MCMSLHYEEAVNRLGFSSSRGSNALEAGFPVVLLSVAQVVLADLTFREGPWLF